MFDKTTYDRVSLPNIIRLALARLKKMLKFFKDKFECDFNSWNLTQGFIFFLEDWLFICFFSFQGWSILSRDNFDNFEDKKRGIRYKVSSHLTQIILSNKSSFSIFHMSRNFLQQLS